MSGSSQSLPVDLLTEILQAITAAVAAVPDMRALGEAAVSILQTGTVSAEQKAEIRRQLDDIKRQIDEA